MKNYLLFVLIFVGFYSYWWFAVYTPYHNKMIELAAEYDKDAVIRFNERMTADSLRWKRYNQSLDSLNKIDQ